jgi:hypothetical protein
VNEQAETGAVSRLTEWVSDVEAGHDTVGADPLTTAILRRRAADTLTILADLERMKAALESIAANTCCDRCQEAALVARLALRHAR